MFFSFQRRSSRTLAIVLGVLAALLPGAYAATARAQQYENVIRFVRNPDAAPDFKLTGLDGKALSLADARGKVILLLRPEDNRLFHLE